MNKQTETGWMAATTNINHAMMGLIDCLESGFHAWIEIRKNGDQTFPVMMKNPKLDNPFNWVMHYGGIRNDAALVDKDYFNDTEKDLTYNWIWCYGEQKAIEAYEKEGRITDGLIHPCGIGHPVRKEDVEKYRKEIEGIDGGRDYLTTYWRPKDGIPYRVVDDSVDEVFVICYNNEPFDKADTLREAGQFLLDYADHVDKLAGWTL